jgi:hypothetical protein
LQLLVVMNQSLRPEVVRPVTRRVTRIALVGAGVGCALVAIELVLAAMPVSVVAFVPPSRIAIPIPVVAPIPAPSVPAPIVAPAPVAPSPRASELRLVFRVGATTYIKLADLAADDSDRDAEAMPRHGVVRLIHDNDDYTTTAIASVRERDVPAAQRAWSGRKVKIDNTCEATVTGFAVVSRLTGSTGYAGLPDGEWTTDNVMAVGTRMLAARLDRCTGVYARDAALPDVIVPERIDGDAWSSAAHTARAMLIASGAAKSTQEAWVGEWQKPGNWWDQGSLTTTIVRHPKTGVVWISVHGHADHGCGEPEVNVWGLFRLESDGSLSTVELRKLGDLEEIDKLVDIDGDGTFELIGHPWLGLDTYVERANGVHLQELGLQFYGCPC